MRIISGQWGGRKINPPAKMPHTRPTTDIAKEGLFNVLANNREIEGMKTLDLFGGTGCISYELASRGANNLAIVEKDPQMFAFIEKNLETLGVENYRMYKLDVFRYIEQCHEKFDFIFAGPPYALATIDDLPLRIFEQKMLYIGGWFVLEHTPRNEYKNNPFFRAERKYGTTIFSIFTEDRDDDV